MATRARKRLRDAEYLLDLARLHAADRERFRLHLEAFIVFARSVLHVLKAEVDEARVFPCFEPEWNSLLKEPLPEFFRDNRNKVIKEGVEATRSRAEYSEIVTVGLHISDTAAVTVIRADGTMETQTVRPASIPEALGKPADTAEASAQYFFTEGPFQDQEALGVCRQYLDRLERSINVAEKCGA